MFRRWFLSRPGLRVRRLLAALVLAFVTWVSLTDPAPLLDTAFDRVMNAVAEFIGCRTDKCVHFLLYFILTFSLWLAFPLRINTIFRDRVPGLLLAGLDAAAWGFLMELSQLLTFWLGWGRREFEWGDALANLLGAMTMTAVLTLIYRGICKRIIARRAPKPPAE